VVVLQFLAFYIFLYVLGRGFLILLELLSRTGLKLTELKIFNLNISIFYTLIGLFFLGNFAFLINFFSGINNMIYYFLILLVCICNLYRFKLPNFTIEGVVNNLITPSILSISTLSAGLHDDASLYHLHYQNWIRSEKIVIGLMNFHKRFGYSSIYDHISSFFWLENNFILLHFINLSFMVFFFGFIFTNIITNKNNNLYFASVFVLIYGVIDNFGFNGGRNGFLYIEGIGKQDVAYSVVFLISNLLIISAISQKKYDKKEFLFVTLLVLFSIQLRMNGLLTLILLFYYFIKIKDRGFKILLPSFVLGFLWVFKNLLISGCLFFPIEETCFSALSWYTKGTAFKDKIIISDFHYGLTTENGITGWYNHWMSSPLNSGIAKNLVLSIIFILLIRLLFLKSNNQISIMEKLLVLGSLALNYYLWVDNSPAIRLGMGLFILTIALIGLNDFEYRFKLKLFSLLENKVSVTALLIVCTLFIPRLYKYSDFIQNPLYNHEVESIEGGTMPNPKGGYGVVPQSGEDCEINLKCTPYATEVDLYELGFLTYKVFK